MHSINPAKVHPAQPDHPPCSQRIHELGILSIRQVHPFLILELYVFWLSSQQSLLGILSATVPVDEQHVHKTHAPAADDGNLGRNVARSVFRSERLGADDVADARKGVSGVVRDGEVR